MTLPQNTYLIAILMSTGSTLLMTLKQGPDAAFKHFKNWFRRKLVYTVRIYQYDELFYILEEYLSLNYQHQYKDVEASLEWSTDNNSPRNTAPALPTVGASQDSRQIYYKQEDNTFIINYKGKKILIEKASNTLEKAESIKQRFFRKYVLTGWRCKKEINELLGAIFREYETGRPKELVKVRVANSYGDWELFDDLHVKGVDKILLSDEFREMIVNDVDSFCTSEAWYKSVGIPYKRGYCFYGSPGNGKTTLSLALASYLNRDVHILNIGSMENDDRLQRCFSGIRKKSILLIEDIDKAFMHREAKQGRVTFSMLLNLLDGALSKHGLIVIITTNHIEQLDPALLRDGRMDMKVEIKNPDNRGISDYLSLFYQQPLTLRGNMPENERICMASIQEICVRNKESYNNALQEITSRIIGDNLEDTNKSLIFGDTTLQQLQFQQCPEI